MSLAVAGLVADGETTVTGAEHVTVLPRLLRRARRAWRSLSSIGYRVTSRSVFAMKSITYLIVTALERVEERSQHTL